MAAHRSTLEAPRRNAGTKLEAPKPGAIHNHAPALSEADFDRSKYARADYAQTDYKRAEYIPSDAAATDYNRTPYQPVTPSAPEPAATPLSRAEARRADPTSWRNDPPVSAPRTGLTPSDPIRDTLGSSDGSRSRGSSKDLFSTRRRSSALEPTASPRASSTRPASTRPPSTRSDDLTHAETWQDAFADITSDPQYGGVLRIAGLLFGLLLIAIVGSAILGGHIFWIMMMFLSFNLAKNADDNDTLGGATSKLKAFLSNFHPALGSSNGLRLASIALGGLSFFMFVIS